MWRQKLTVVCWVCRVGLKRLSIEVYGDANREQAGYVRGATCPSCGDPLAFVGGRFHTPKKGDLKGWKSAYKWWLRRTQETVKDQFRARTRNILESIEAKRVKLAKKKG